jgi:hypothetical protein
LVRAETMDGALRPRQVFWCSREHAQHYIAHRIAELIAPPVQPQEMPMAGPSEVKKSLPEESAGQQTDSAASSDHGTGPLLSAQQAAQVSALSKPYRSTLALPKKRRGS